MISMSFIIFLLLAVQSADSAPTGRSEHQRSVCVYTSSTGALNHWEEEVFRPEVGGHSGETRLIGLLSAQLTELIGMCRGVNICIC